MKSKHISRRLAALLALTLLTTSASAGVRCVRLYVMSQYQGGYCWDDPAWDSGGGGTPDLPVEGTADGGSGIPGGPSGNLPVIPVPNMPGVTVSPNGKYVRTTEANCSDELALRARMAQGALAVNPLMPIGETVQVTYPGNVKEKFKRIYKAGSVQFGPVGTCG